METFGLISERSEISPNADKCFLRQIFRSVVVIQKTEANSINFHRKFCVNFFKFHLKNVFLPRLTLFRCRKFCNATKKINFPEFCQKFISDKIYDYGKTNYGLRKTNLNDVPQSGKIVS